MKQGGKNVPRLGRRNGYQSQKMSPAELKYYSHVQPFDSKFILDFLADESFISEGDLKFVSWSDFDKALEIDPELKSKLIAIARDKEINELKKLISDSNDDDKGHITFVPYGAAANFGYNIDRDAYYYGNQKRGSTQEMQL